MVDTIFKIDNSVKQEFLDSKPTATAHSNVFVLKLVDEFEVLAEKNVYDMSYSELREMIAMQFKNLSIGTIVKNISIIRKYIDFCIEKNLVSHMENRLATFTRQEARAFVSKQAMEFRYITKEDLRKYQDILENNQDKLLLQLPYVGVRGRTTRDGTLEEIINLQIELESEDTKNGILHLVKNNSDKRYLKVDDYTMDLIIDTYKEEFYIANNGIESELMKGGIRKKPINKIGKYVFRTPGTKKNELFNPVLINSRIQRIQKWTGNNYITIHSLFMSGMITMAKEIFAKNGELTTQDYIRICARYDYGAGDPKKYVTVLKDIASQYI